MLQLNICKIVLISILVVLSSGCLKQNPTSKSGWYTVSRGDTLYAIAKKHRKSIAEIARSNNLRSPYTLKSGQKLKINNSSPVITKPVVKKQILTAKKSPLKPQPSYQTKQNVNLIVKDHIKWGWPARGVLSEKFVQGQSRQNGISIINKLGTPVYSAADGVVIYSGDALRGYGNLIIIKHDKNYLTAYAHNQKIIVKEKESVTLGQQIGNMGASGIDKVKLHFEIRYHGKPIDPIKLLP